MKIEKLHENKIKITFSPEDLIRHNLTIESVKNNAPGVKQIILDIVRSTEAETGFSLNDCNLMVETIPMKDESMVMYITKIDNDSSVKELSKLLPQKKLRPRPRTLPEEQLFAIKLSDFEDGISLARFSPEFDGGTLYFYNNSYYIILTSPLSRSSEFGVLISDINTCRTVEEHGKLICTDALKTLREYFS